MSEELEKRIGYHLKRTVGEETVKSFVPKPLLPVPAIDLSRFQILIERANHALGRLDEATKMLPQLDIFIYQWIRKEALLSS